MKKKEEKDMLTPTKKAKPIPKTQVGLNNRQKRIMKEYVGKSPTPPVDLNKVRDWEKYGDR